MSTNQSKWFIHLGHRCEVWTFWNSDPKQTPECIHAALRSIITTELQKAIKRGTPVTDVILFSDRCGEQFSGRKNFRMCSETASLLSVLILWIFACPHHFAGVWDAWGGTEARLLKNIEISGHDTMRTTIDCVLKLRELRADLISNANQDADTVEDDTVDDHDDASDYTCVHCPTATETTDICEEVGATAATSTNIFKAHGCHVMLLQLCPCRSAEACTCVPDSRVKDTIFYRRDTNYDAETIKGCASMFAYRFLPNRKYIVQIREYACETCPGCAPTRAHDRYHGCTNLATVRARSYRCAGYNKALKSTLCETTGWVEHRIQPIITTHLAGTRATDGLTHLDHRSRLEYVGKLKPGDNVFMANTDSTSMLTEFRPRDFWIAQLLPPPDGVPSVVWKTRHQLPPDCAPGTYCCKIQWFRRTTVDGRVFKPTSAQYISLSCIVPVQFPITLDQIDSSRYELSTSTEQKILTTLKGLIIDD